MGRYVFGIREIPPDSAVGAEADYNDWNRVDLTRTSLAGTPRAAWLSRASMRKC